MQRGNAQLVVSMDADKHTFMARMRIGSRYSGISSHGDSIDLAISRLEDALMNEMTKSAENKKVKKSS